MPWIAETFSIITSGKITGELQTFGNGNGAMLATMACGRDAITSSLNMSGHVGIIET